MRIAIIGAGIAGLSCAVRLGDAGHAVTLFDKGRGPGGRMATRRIDTDTGLVAFDHGAQYFTARDPQFVDQVASWHAEAVVVPWPAAGDDAWVGTPGMNAVVKAMANEHDVRWGTRIEAIRRDGGRWSVDPVADASFDAVIIATPAEQAAPLLAPHAAAMANAARDSVSSPCWTAMFGFTAPLPVAADVVRHAGIIGWAARNNAKPGRTVPAGTPETWVVQATPEWSTAHLEEDAATVVDALADALSQVAGAPLPDAHIRVGHRWRFARVTPADHGVQWDAAARIGAVGDWLVAPRVESAWVSGQRLADRILSDRP